MPIVIDQPISGGAFGPGFNIQVSTTTVGPFTSPHWDATLFDSTNEVQLQFDQFTVSNPHLVTTDWVYTENDFIAAALSQYSNGLNGNLRMRLWSGGSISETSTIPIKIDTVSGVLPMIQTQITNSAGAFTPTDRANLETVQTNVAGLLTGVFTELPGFGGQLINNIVGNPPVQIVTRELIGEFTNCGTLQRPAFGASTDAFGIAWEVVSYGGGIGLDANVPQRFEVNLLDFELRHTDHDGHEFTSNTSRFDYSNGYWFFSPVLPTRLNYCIAPSVTMRFYWLLVTL